MDLKEWAIAYIKNKDMAQKKVVKIDDKKDFLEVHYKDKMNKHFMTLRLDEKILPSLQNNDAKTVVCNNSEENFKFLTRNWNKLSAISNLTLIFVNLINDDKWIINPKLHSMIADSSTIESGLRTMFDTANGKIADVKVSRKKSPMFEESSESDDGMEEEN